MSKTSTVRLRPLQLIEPGNGVASDAEGFSGAELRFRDNCIQS